ncbi:hypothetical protein V8V91_04695 [Algoriphagus halophilus]|uniref:hypothetical protein n=1 Tax=Algoriphagus halophilus TaxID=226505 RepID=UPI00358E0CAB
MNGSVPVNDDNSLEKEADIMGGKANGNQIAIRKTLSDAPSSALTQMKSYPQVFQLRKLSEEEIETMDKDFLEFFRQLEDALKPFLPKKSNEEKRSSDFQERGNTLAKSGIKVLKGEEKLSSAVSEQVTTSDKIDLLKKASEIGSSFLGSANSSNQSEGRSPSNQTSTEKNESAKGGFLDSFDLFSSSEPKEKPKKEKRKVENESPSIFSSFFSNKDSPTSRGEGKQSSGTSSGILEGLNEGELRAASKILVKGAKAKVNVDEGQRRAENGVVNTFGRIGGFLGKGIGKVEDFFADNGLVSKGESDIQSLESQYQRIVSKIDQIKDPEAFRQAKDLYHQRDQAAINHLERFRMLIVEYKSDPKASQNRAQEHLFELQETNPGEPGILGKTKGVFNAIGNAFSSGAKSISNFASETATSAKKTFGEIKEEANRSIFDKKISFLDEVEEKL